MNLVKGWQNWLQDVVRQIRQEPPEGVEAFTPGRDVAVTPGKVIFRNHLIELDPVYAHDRNRAPRAGADRSGLDHEILYPRPQLRRIP